MEHQPENCKTSNEFGELIGLVQKDVESALKGGDDRSFKWLIKYALREIMPEWDIMEHIITENADGEFAADFLCVSQESAKLMEVVTTPDKYSQTRYKTLMELSELIVTESASSLFHSAATMCAKSRLKQRKQALGATCEQLESSKFDLSRIQRCEVVFITPEEQPWFELTGATRVTFEKLADACENRTLANMIISALK